MRPASLREVADRIRGDGDWDHHTCEFLDGFYTADGESDRQAAMIREDPGFVGMARTDAYLGGVGEHLARRWCLPIPRWVRDDARYLDAAWFLPDERNLRGYLLCVSPVSFRARLIFTGPDPLQRARFPYHRGVLTLPFDYPPAPLTPSPPSAAAPAGGSPPGSSPGSRGGSAR
ncbi:hypothetical protein Q8W71_08160 [Methylobacterium sp. NEAU 140]|uniref:hypothetical protein n=1 Tax=Methylobacterium sp. NEAU 140 TaxID=3064945 RepID=UPI0027363AA1|nr:hypothetical protein [Methylobacterium sp. NEAU 140]MDP4022591.1 hypothetical protein [Methylobacterium sp. NEAU 140]